MSRRRRCCALAWWSLALAVAVSVESVSRAQIPGDFDGNGVLDAVDLDLFAIAIVDGPCWACDLNDDGMITFEDRLMWVHELKNTWIGDANLDGQFNSGDFVQVFARGKYETGQDAGWEEGDFNGDMQFTSGDMVAAFADGGYERPLPGDYNRNGLLDAGDLDLQAIAIVTDPGNPFYDLNEDGVLDFRDREMWVYELKNTWLGDANLDYQFNSSDMVQVFVAGTYETDEYAGWEEGDFNADMRFTSGDLVATWICEFDSCIYDNGGGRKPEKIPEPSGWLLLSLAMIFLLRFLKTL